MDDKNEALLLQDIQNIVERLGRIEHVLKIDVPKEYRTPKWLAEQVERNKLMHDLQKQVSQFDGHYLTTKGAIVDMNVFPDEIIYTLRINRKLP